MCDRVRETERETCTKFVFSRGIFSTRLLSCRGEALHPPQTSPHGKGIPPPQNPLPCHLAPFCRSIYLPRFLRLAQEMIHGRRKGRIPPYGCWPKIETPGRSKVVFVTQFLSVLSFIPRLHEFWILTCLLPFAYLMVFLTFR